MMEINTFGVLQIIRDGVPVGGFASRKAEALLVYLVCEPRPHPRDVLADLLWDDRSTERARGNLSVLLSSLRQQLGDYMLIDRQYVRFNAMKPYTLDAAILADAFDRCTHECRTGLLPSDAVMMLEHALELYRGEFLHGFSVRNSAGFEQWMLSQQDRWRERIIAVRERLAETYVARRQIAQGLDQVSAILRIDPFHDAAHRLMLDLLMANGQRGAALSHYAHYVQLLHNELGIGPDEQVCAVYARIADEAVLAARPMRGLPTPTTAFVGKNREIAEIAEQLRDDTCRLMTLLGPGGIGKTRAAIEVARRCGEHFTHGVVFIPLADVHTESELIGAVADGLGLMQYDGTRVEQILAFVRERNMVLVLDNVEQVVHATGVLSQWLLHAPRLTILATSRERLQLHGEWITTLQGLAYPEKGALLNENAPQQFSAIALFVQTARRVRGDLIMDARAYQAIGAICRLVEGSPLAIELAASWARSMNCELILTEIERSFDVLQTSLRDMPHRHRSMRAVFDSSWALLDAPARTVLARATVFRGGFMLDDAVAVLPDEQVPFPLIMVLTDLLDRSFLRQDTHGRYDMHEFVRHYAAEQLDTTARVRARHSAHFAALVAQQAAVIRTMAQPLAMAALEREFANIAAAWNAARDAHDWQTLGTMVDGLARYDDSCGRFTEGYERYQTAEAALQRAEPDASVLIRADMLREMGVLAERMGCYQTGNECVARSMVLAASQHDSGRLARAQIVRGRILERQGHPDLTLELGEAALAALRASGDAAGVADALHTIGSAYEALQLYREAQQVMSECLMIRQQLGHGRTRAFSLNLLGILHEMLNELDTAAQLYEQSVALFSALGERWAMLLPLSNLGDVALTRGKIDAAHRYYQRAIALAHEIGGAQQMMMLLVKQAILLAPRDPRQALEILQAPLHHPATEESFRLQARVLAEQLQ